MKRIGIATAALMLALAPVSYAFAQAPGGTTVSNGTVYNSQGAIVGTVGTDGAVTSGGITIGWIIGGAFVAGALGLGIAEIASSNNNNGCTTVVVSGVSRCQ